MYLDRNKTQTLIDAGKKRGLTGQQVLDGLIERGYEPEGIDLGQAKVAIAQTRRETSGFASEAGEDLSQIGGDIASAANSRMNKFDQIDAAQKSGEQGPLRSLFQKFGQGAAFAGDVVGSTLKGIGKAFLPEKAEVAVGDTFTKTVQAIGDTALAQEGAALYSELKQKDPALARDLEATLNIALLAADVGTAGIAGRPAAAIVKGAGEVATEAGKVAGKVGALPVFGTSEVSGALTGTSGETIRQAFAAARAGGDELKLFTDGLRKRTTPEQLVNRLREATDVVNSEKSARFGEMIDTIGDTTVDTSGIRQSVLTDLDGLGIKVGDEGQLDFSASKFRTVPSAQTKLQAMYDEVNGIGDQRTLREVDTSRQALGALELAGEDNAARTANMVITKARNAVRTAGTKVEGYDQALTQFADDAEFLGEINRALSAGDQATIDTAYRKLATTLKTNNEQRMSLLKELDEATGGYLLSSIAGQQLSEELPRGIFRQIAAGMVGTGVVTGGVTTAALPALLFASPRATGEVLRALGIAAGKVDELGKALQKIRSDLKIVPVKNPPDNE